MLFRSDVSWFQVSVDYLCFVKIFQAAQNVIHDSFYLQLVKMFAGLDQLLQVHVALAEHQIHFVKFQLLDRSLRVAIDSTRRNHAKKFVAARMRHLLEDSHFPNQSTSPLGVAKYMFVALTGILSLGI